MDLLDVADIGGVVCELAVPFVRANAQEEDDEEGRDHAGQEEADAAAEDEGGEGAGEFGGGAGPDEADGLEGEGVAGDDEEEAYHGGARVEEAQEGEGEEVGVGRVVAVAGGDDEACCGVLVESLSRYTGGWDGGW